MDLSPEDITDIFGSPTRVSDKKNYTILRYEMSEVCDEDTFSLIKLIFKFENQKTKDVELSVGTTLICN